MVSYACYGSFQKALLSSLREVIKKRILYGHAQADRKGLQNMQNMQNIQTYQIKPTEPNQ